MHRPPYALIGPTKGEYMVVDISAVGAMPVLYRNRDFERATAVVGGCNLSWKRGERIARAGFSPAQAVQSMFIIEPEQGPEFSTVYAIILRHARMSFGAMRLYVAATQADTEMAVQAFRYALTAGAKAEATHQ